MFVAKCTAVFGDSNARRVLHNSLSLRWNCCPFLQYANEILKCHLQRSNIFAQIITSLLGKPTRSIRSSSFLSGWLRFAHAFLNQMVALQNVDGISFGLYVFRRNTSMVFFRYPWVFEGDINPAILRGRKVHCWPVPVICPRKWGWLRQGQQPNHDADR